MSVETRVIVDGQWVTRTMGIDQILARNRHEEPVPLILPVGPRPPVVGLLTKTVVKSPLINLIIPARIRHRSKNDVVFVYEDSIEIKEVLGGERIEDNPFSQISLDNAVVKNDFDSSIKNAKVMGQPREPKTSRFPGRFWDGQFKPESTPETKTEPFHENEVPPQILVLTLASRVLVFIFAYYDIHEAVHFLSRTWPLPAQIPLMEELGLHLAVDPKSRALAVGAYENRISIYALKSMEQIRDEVQNPGSLDAADFNPIREERHLNVDGFILMMDFLHPSEGDEHFVILLLIIAKREKIQLVHFEWDSRSSLREFDLKPSQPLSRPDRQPLLLLPLTHGTVFALVFEQEIVIYRNILTGEASGQACSLEHYEPPEEPGITKKPPIWTQWARPMRAIDRRDPKVDNIYLCREDGVVRYIEIRGDKLSSNHQAGILGTNVGVAFATLDLGDESNDLLVAAGEMGDGGLWYFQPRAPLDLVITLRNWTPLKGMTNTELVHPHDFKESMTAPSSAGRLFACSGRGPRHSAVIEIRVGTEAVMLEPAINFGEQAAKGVENIWSLPDRSATGIYLIVGHPTETELVFLPASDSLGPKACGEIEELDLDARTIAAGSTADGFIIQVTPFAIYAIAQEAGVLPLSHSTSGATVTAAAFLTIPSVTTILVTVLRKANDFYLCYGHFGTQDGRIAYVELAEPTLLQSEATCVSVHWVEEQLAVFVGTVAGTLETYTADPGSGFSLRDEYSFDEQLALCNSLAMITAHRGTGTGLRYTLICGLRNGSIQTLALGKSGNIEPPSLIDRLKVGTTSVKVIVDSTRGSRAIAWCEQALYTLEYLGGRGALTNPVIFNRIWLTDPNKPAFVPHHLSCFTQASSTIPQGYSTYGAGSLFCLTGNDLLLADLSPTSESALVPRRIPLNGTATRVFHSEKLNKLIVLYTATLVGPIPRERSRRERAKSAIAFIDPDAQVIRPNLETEGVFDEIDIADGLKPRERILDIVEWFPSHEATQYHVLIAHTIIGIPAGNEATGRLLLYYPKLSNSGQVVMALKSVKDCEAPVWCVRPYGARSLVYACGEDLIFRELDMRTKRFTAKIKITLRSRASHISVEGDLIHVSTKGSGHHTFFLDNGHIIPLCADANGRPNMHHLVLPDLAVPEGALVLTAGKGGVTGLWQPAQRQLSRTAPVLFEATLPGSVTRLWSITKPEWQHMVRQVPITSVLGVSEDGALYQFAVLDRDAWKLLAFLQNLAMRDSRICPYPPPFIREKHIEPQATKKKDMHINGDILNRLLENGGSSLLEEMLGREPDPHNTSSDYSTALDRRKRFEELVTIVLDHPMEGHHTTAAIDLIHRMLIPAI